MNVEKRFTEPFLLQFLKYFDRITMYIYIVPNRNMCNNTQKG